MNYKDLTGIKFGNLTAKRYVGNSKWECLCDCGNLVIRGTGHLCAGGDRQSCGCSKRLDLVGKTFGKLKVTKFAYIKNKCSYWECECECGNVDVYKGAYLTNGKYRHCRSQFHKMENLIGKRFCSLVVLEYAGQNERGASQWKCRCDCGNEKIVLDNHLKCGSVKSCGHMKSLIGQKFNRLTVVEFSHYDKSKKAYWK